LLTVVVVGGVYLIYFISVVKIPRVNVKVKCVKNKKLECDIVG